MKYKVERIKRYSVLLLDVLILFTVINITSKFLELKNVPLMSKLNFSIAWQLYFIFLLAICRLYLNGKKRTKRNEQVNESSQVIRTSKLFRLCFFIFLLLTGYLYYHSAMNNCFVEDDWRLLGYGREITENFGFKIIWNYLTAPRANMPDNYRPLPFFLFGLNYWLGGMNPFGYHLLNLFIHVVNAYLVFSIALYVTESSLAGLLAGVIFLLHPIQAEPVIWLTIRESLTPALFYFLSILFYLRFLKNNQKTDYIFAFSSAVIGFLSYEILVSIPVTIFVMDFLNRKKLDSDLALRVIPFLLLFIGYIFLRYQIIGSIDRTGWEHTNSLATVQGIQNTARSVFIDMPRVLAIPVRSNMLRGEKIINYTQAAKWAGIAGAFFIFYCSRRRRADFKVILFCIFWMLIVISPVAQHLVGPENLHQSRRYYLPSLGFSILLAYFISLEFHTKKNVKKIVTVILFSGFLIYFSRCAKENISYWLSLGKEFEFTRKYYEKIPQNVLQEDNRYYLPGESVHFHGPLVFEGGFYTKYFQYYKVFEDLKMEKDGKIEDFEPHTILSESQNRLLMIGESSDEFEDATGFIKNRLTQRESAAGERKEICVAISEEGDAQWESEFCVDASIINPQRVESVKLNFLLPEQNDSNEKSMDLIFAWKSGNNQKYLINREIELNIDREVEESGVRDVTIPVQRSIAWILEDNISEICVFFKEKNNFQLNNVIFIE